MLCVLMIAGCGTLHKRVAPESEGGAAPASPSASSSSSSSAPAPAGKRSGGYYQDDGPGDHPPANLDKLPDAVPKAEPLRVAANRPYAVFGHEYVPMTSLKPYRQKGVASWYGKKFQGAQTSSGEPYDMYAMTAAHPTLPIPSYARVTNLANSRSVVVRVNDRGPFLSERIMDLSYAAAYKLGYVQAGSARVEVESIDPARYVPAAVAKNNGPPAASTSHAAPVAEVAPSNSGRGAPVVDAMPAAVPPPVEAALLDPPGATSAVAAAATAAISAPPPTVLPPSAVAAPPATVAPAPPASIPVASDASGFYLQLGAFSVRDNAENFRARVARQLDWVSDPIRVVSGDGLYRVHLGPFRDRADADRMAAKIRGALELTPTVVVK
jgi:peptidoglycan lytic transglycosylase